MSNEIKTTTYVRTTDEGTDTTVIAIHGDEAFITYLTDGVETGEDVYDADSERLHQVVLSLRHDGYREV